MVIKINIQIAAVLLLMLVAVSAFGTYSLVADSSATPRSSASTAHVGVYVIPRPTETDGMVSAEVADITTDAEES